MTQIQKYCTVAEASHMLGKNKHTIRAMYRDGRIKGTQFGKSGTSPIYIERESLAGWQIKCVTCFKNAPVQELLENAKLGGYGFKKICNTCAQEIDGQMDSQQQDKN